MLTRILSLYQTLVYPLSSKNESCQKFLMSFLNKSFEYLKNNSSIDFFPGKQIILELISL